MKIITYSDLHLEFGADFLPPSSSDADLMVLAGDIIVFSDTKPLERILSHWKKPVLYVAGNHEFYTRTPMRKEAERFKNWLVKYPQVIFLQDEAVSMNDVHFFGGTMWTDFCGGNAIHMMNARHQMNDFYLIMESENIRLTPDYTLELHTAYADKLIAWFEEDLSGPRVVISHHAPVINPRTRYGKSPLRHAFNSLDMIPLIEAFQPALWIYGHTHECDDQWVGNTRILSNQMGYPNEKVGFSGVRFDPEGKPLILGQEGTNPH